MNLLTDESGGRNFSTEVSFLQISLSLWQVNTKLTSTPICPLPYNILKSWLLRPLSVAHMSMEHLPVVTSQIKNESPYLLSITP